MSRVTEGYTIVGFGEVNFSLNEDYMLLLLLHQRGRMRVAIASPNAWAQHKKAFNRFRRNG